MQQGRGGTGDLGRSVCGPGPQTVCGCRVPEGEQGVALAAFPSAVCELGSGPAHHRLG